MSSLLPCLACATGAARPRPPRRVPRLAVALALGACLAAAVPAARAAEPAAATPPWIEVRLEGLDKELSQAVLKSLTIVRRARDERSAAPPVARRLHNLTLEQVRLVLESRGYYHAQVHGSIERAGERWLTTYRVEVGSRVVVTTIEVKLRGAGRDDPELERLRREFPLRAGSPLDQEVYERGKAELLRTARARGYLEATFPVHAVTVDLATDQVTVALEMDTGPRYRFGQLIFRQGTFDDAFLHRFAPFRTGEPYDTRELGQLQRRLSESGLFKDIRVEALTDEPKGLDVPVEVTLTPRARNRYTAALGYGTDRGLWLRLKHHRRWLNAFGHDLRSDLEWSERDALAQFIYRVPLADPVDEALNTTAKWEREDTTDTSRETTSLGVDRVRTRRQHGYSFGITWLREDYQAGSAPRETTELLMPSASWRWTSAPDPVWVARGFSLSGRVTGAVEGVISDVTLGQVSGEARLIWPLGSKGRLLARTNIGVTAIDDDDDLPVSLRYFAGGSLSVRGYGYQDLAPRDEFGDVVGGSNLITASLEYEHRLHGQLFAAAFVDIGNAFNGTDPDLKRGAGFGVRYALPFGMVRLDLATALDRDGNPWRVHFSVGPDL